MAGYSLDSHRSKTFSLFIFCILLIFPLWGCGGGGPGGSPDASAGAASDTGTGSATFSVQWHDAVQLQDLSASAVTREALDCQASGVATVVSHIYDDAGTLLVTGGPWDCEIGGARIDGIPVGQNRMFVVLAEDAQGEVIYQGETAGITIGSGVTGVTIDAFPFVPDLLTPADGAQQVDPTNVTLTWASIANADQYLMQVAQDTNFNAIRIDDISPVLDPAHPSYMPAGLLPSTTYFWRISAVDLNANIGGASAVRSFSTSNCTSTISPTSQTVGPGASSYAVDVTTSLSICSWTSASNVAWVTLSPNSGTGDGTVTVSVAANSGQTRNTTVTIAGQAHTVTQTGETTPPTVTITSPTTDSSTTTNTRTLNIAGNASDNVGVTQVTWSNSRGGSDTCSGTTTWSASGISLAPGRNVITVTASDAAGNTGTDTLTITFTDNTPPTVTIASPTTNATYSTNDRTLNIAGTASDDVGVTQVTWANSQGGGGTCSGTAAWSANGISLVPGQNVITVTAVDAAGNTGTDTLTVTFTDITPPTVTITSPASSDTYVTTNATVDIAGSASDNVGVTQVTWTNSQKGGGTCSGTTSWSAAGIALSLGDNIITVTARDAAGNTSTDTLTVTYRIPPDYTVTALALGATTVLRGLPMNVTYRAINQGGAPQNCVNMAIVLSSDASITSSDIVLQRWGLPNCSLAAGESISQTWTVTIPATTAPGTYYIGIIADVDQNETESNENNNTMATPITVYILG